MGRSQMTTANQIRALRIERDMSAVALAAAAVLSRSHLEKLESGATVPSILTAYRLADALGVEVDAARLEALLPDRED